MTNTKDTTNNELMTMDCSILIEEVREKVQRLKDYGMSETDIVSCLHTNQPLPKLIISRSYRLFLGEERKEVHMEPILKAVYLLFLKHPEGIAFKYLPDYRQELAEIYNYVRPWGLTDRAIRSIEDVTNPLLNSINEKCARIRKTFTNLLGPSMADNYCVKGKRGEVKKISLPHDLVVWE